MSQQLRWYYFASSDWWPKVTWNALNYSSRDAPYSADMSLIISGELTSKKLQKSHYKASKTLDFEGGRQTIFMASIPNSIQSASAVQSHMLSYIDEAVQQADKQHKCRVNSDSDWVRYGIDRVLHRAIQAWPWLTCALIRSA